MDRISHRDLLPPNICRILSANQKKDGADVPWNSAWIVSTDDCFRCHHHLVHSDDVLCQQQTVCYHGGFCGGPDSFPDYIPAEIVSSLSVATTNSIQTIDTGSISKRWRNGGQDIDARSNDDDNRVGGIRWEQ